MAEEAGLIEKLNGLRSDSAKLTEQIEQAKKEKERLVNVCDNDGVRESLKEKQLQVDLEKSRSFDAYLDQYIMIYMLKNTNLDKSDSFLSEVITEEESYRTALESIIDEADHGGLNRQHKDRAIYTRKAD